MVCSDLVEIMTTPAQALPIRLEHHPEGNFIYGHFADGSQCRVLDIRGWGHLTGGAAKALPEKEAIEIQNQWGEAIVAAYNAALSASPVDRIDGWEPIETAPKDGSKILLWPTDGSHHNHCEPQTTIAYWISDGRGYWRGWNMCRRPTHWMPLPAAPLPPGADIAGGE